MQRVFIGIGANLTIALILIGVPGTLIVLLGNPLPTFDEGTAILRLEPDWGNRILLGVVLPCTAWIAWALFAIPLFAEIFDAVARRQHRTIVPGFGIQRRAARTLVAAALFTAVVSTVPATASNQAHAEPTRTLTAPHPQPPNTAPAESIADAHRVPVSAEKTQVRTYEVRRGDTLWDVADHYLGTGRDFPVIVAASRDIEQTGGGKLTNPDLILPGWRLNIPQRHRTDSPPRPGNTRSDEPGPAQPATAPTATPTPSDEGSTHPSELPVSSPPTQPSTAAEHVEPQTFVDSAPIAVAGGVAAALATAVVVILGRRRRTQRQARGIGDRLAMPGPDLDDTEQQIRAVHDPSLSDDLLRALRAIQIWAEDTSANLPELLAVRIDDEQISLYLAQPAELPAPYEPAHGDHTAWTVTRTALTQPDRPVVAPYPALVTIGTDHDDGLLLLDLEQLRTLTVTSDDDSLARAAMNAIAAELASAPWADDIHLSLVGLPSTLPFALDPYRIHQVTDIAALSRDLRVHLADREQALQSLQVADIRLARVTANDVEAWAPFVVLIATDCTPAEHDELAALNTAYGPSGLVLVQLQPNRSTGTSLQLHTPTSAEYFAAGTGLPPLPYTPQLVDDTTLEALLKLFAISETPPTAQPELAQLHDSGPTPTPTLVPAPAPSPSPSDETVDPSTGDPRTRTAPAHRAPLVEQRTPYVRILGPIDAQHLTGHVDLPGRGIEFLTYLLTHQQPIPGAQIQKALWPNSYDRSNNNTRTLAKQVRSALGHDDAGHLWLPEGRGSSGFTLHPGIRSDWHDFVALTTHDPATASTDALDTALRLVRGQPLLGADAHRGRWAWRTALEEEILATILDTAAILAERAIASRDSRLTRIAARTVRATDPLNELSWQIELKAAIAGDDSDIERIIADLYLTAGAGDLNYEPDALTNDLIAAAQRITQLEKHR